MNENGLLTRLDSFDGSDGNELCCEICFVKFHSVFRIPKNFPCGHCFCEQCVTRLTSAVPPWSIKCPKCCQVGFSINAKFPSNYILCDILRKMELHSKEMERKCIGCDVSNDVVKMHYCATCFNGDCDASGIIKNWLCGTCISAHIHTPLTHEIYTYQELKKVNDDAKKDIENGQMNIVKIGAAIDRSIDCCQQSLQGYRHIISAELSNYDKLRVPILSKFDDHCLMSNEDVKKLKFAAQAIETTASIKANGMLQDMKRLQTDERIATLLAEHLKANSDDEQTQHFVISLFVNMSLEINSEQKIILCNSGVIELILNQIERRLALVDGFDGVMLDGWNFLWTVTDETFINCERFVNSGGLQLFYRCIQKCEQDEWPTTFIGPIANVAEYMQFSSHLANDDYIKLFSEIINDKSRPITARFIAMHILAHLLCADSDTNQLLDDTRRSTISNDILQLLDDCNIADTNLDIEYRSMKPFFRLIESKSNTAQYYAIWTIANLTTSTQHSMKYCRLIQNETNGIATLLTFANESETKIKQLATRIVENIEKRLQPGTI